MRVWDLHPGYLSQSSLLGQHAEIHALFSVLMGGKRGYWSHPETLRWKGHLRELSWRHELTVREMILRGLQHRSPLGVIDDLEPEGPGPGFVDPPLEQFRLLEEKYRGTGKSGRIPFPLGARDFWIQHRRSLRARNADRCRDLGEALREGGLKGKEPHISEILEVLSTALHPGEMRREILCMWEEIEGSASPEEANQLLDCPGWPPTQLLKHLYRLALKYEKVDIASSTLLADRWHPELA